MIKTTDHFHVFATKLHFMMYGKYILYLSLPHTRTYTQFPHVNIHANVVSATLMILSVTVSLTTYKL